MTTHDGTEVEIKFQVRDAQALERSLESAGFHQKTPSTLEANTLYDNASGALRRAGEVLRLRIYGDRCLLTHKSPGAAVALKHKTRIEHETAVGSVEQMHAILTALGFRVAFRYEKFRAEWSDGEGEVVIDRTPIGDLAEIEGAPQWIDRIAMVLGLSENDYITASYAELFFGWKERTGSAALHMTFEQCGTPRP
jgi:adenylate cyclase class 2